MAKADRKKPVRKGPVREKFDADPAGQVAFHKARVKYDVGEILKMLAMFDEDPGALENRAGELIANIMREVVGEMTNATRKGSAETETAADGE